MAAAEAAAAARAETCTASTQDDEPAPALALGHLATNPLGVREAEDGRVAFGLSISLCARHFVRCCVCNVEKHVVGRVTSLTVCGTRRAPRRLWCGGVDRRLEKLERTVDEMTNRGIMKSKIVLR